MMGTQHRRQSPSSPYSTGLSSLSQSCIMVFMRLHHTVAHLFHPRRSNNHRPRVLHPESLVILSLLLVAFVTTLGAFSRLPSNLGLVLGFASSITPTQVIAQTNDQRAQVGLPPLKLNDQLSSAALAKGQHMLLQQYWAHTAPDGTQPWKFFKDSGYRYQVAGENLARDFNTTDEMVSAWMASPTHKANMVSGRYEEIGIAVIDGTLEGYETTLVVQLFGQPASGQTQARVPAESAATVTIEAQPRAELSKPEVSPAPSETTEPPLVLANAPQQNRGEYRPSSPAVLSSALVPQGSIAVPPLFSPLQLIKAFFLAMILMIVGTLVYDSFIIGHRSAMRLVGQNLGHIALFVIVAYLLISFKGGILG